MFTHQLMTTLRKILTLSTVIWVVSCAPAATQPPAALAPTSAPAATATVPAIPAATATPLATAVPVAATAVSALPATPTATQTPVAAVATEAPAAPAASAEGGLSAWCLPEDASLALAADPANPPAGARMGQYVKDALEVRNLPASACVILYTFDQPAADGLKLEVYETNQKTPWLTAELKPVEGQPNTASALLRHSYIIAPPYWNISYVFAVRDANGQELRRDAVNLHRWVPKLCWNGQPPNVNTLRCPLPQDLHPWDPSYGTPIPTFPPED